MKRKYVFFGVSFLFFFLEEERMSSRDLAVEGIS